MASFSVIRSAALQVKNAATTKDVKELAALLMDLSSACENACKDNEMLAKDAQRDARAAAPKR